jgi:predicted transcriptional regulator
MLLEGSKTIEFRRRGPGRDAIGMHVIVYASAPVSALVGYGNALDSLRREPAELWRRYAHRSGITEHDFETYFAGAVVGDALLLECWPLADNIDLGSLRSRYNWRPPMSWSWLRASSPLLALVPARQR